MKEKNDRTIGVIGSGVMGTGVAQRFSFYGSKIRLLDVKQEALDNALNMIKKNLFLYNMSHSDKVDVQMIMERITIHTEYICLEDVDYVIENIPEIVSEKEKVYKQIKNICKEDCIFMVNTSCIPISYIGEIAGRSDKVIGVHFMNPVPLQNFSEVIKGKETSEDTVSSIKELLLSVGLDCTVINDSPGFVSNRVSHLFMNEASKLAQEGVATPEQIDQIFTQGFHHKMGPLQTADLIGIDTVVDSLDVLYSYYEEEKYQCSNLLRQMVKENKLGRKTRKGFYQY